MKTITGYDDSTKSQDRRTPEKSGAALVNHKMKTRTAEAPRGLVTSLGLPVSNYRGRFLKPVS